VNQEGNARTRSRGPGDLVTPSSGDDNETRQIWNGDIDRRPAASARCRGVADESTAYPNRGARHDINVLGAWLPGDPESERCRSWVREFYNALAPHADGVDVNFLSDERTDVLAGVYGAEKLARLRAVKRKYDPTNFFRHNSNITPGGSPHSDSSG